MFCHFPFSLLFWRGGGEIETLSFLHVADQPPPTIIRADNVLLIMMMAGWLNVLVAADLWLRWIKTEDEDGQGCLAPGKQNKSFVKNFNWFYFPLEFIKSKELKKDKEN